MGSPEVNGHRGPTVRDFVDLARRMMLYGVALGLGFAAVGVGLTGVAFQEVLTLKVGVGLAFAALILLVGVALWPSRR